MSFSRQWRRFDHLSSFDHESVTKSSFVQVRGPFEGGLAQPGIGNRLFSRPPYPPVPNARPDRGRGLREGQGVMDSPALRAS